MGEELSPACPDQLGPVRATVCLSQADQLHFNR